MTPAAETRNWKPETVLSKRSQRGMTLVELIVSIAIIAVLAVAAMPLARLTVRREKERELRNDLNQMRDAIDHYKEAADRGLFQVKLGSENYPPDLETLVNGIDIGKHKVRFLRRIPVDPMTGRADWGMRSLKDDPTTETWGGDNVFDVYSQSQETALNGTKYKDW